MATIYKMIGKLTDESWVAWISSVADIDGLYYYGGGVLIPETIQIGGKYNQEQDYTYKMLGKLISGTFVSWMSEFSPDYIGASYTGGGTLDLSTIQIGSKYILAIPPTPPIPPSPVFDNYSTYFDGTGYVTMGDAIDLSFERTSAFSISCWVKTTDVSAFIISKMDVTPKGYGILVDASGKAQLILSNTAIIKVDVYSAASINDNSWNHVIFTYDGSGVAAGVTCYINGVPNALSTTTDNLSTNTIITTAEFNISGRTNGTSLLEGYVDEVSVYNKELSVGEVTEIYNSGVPSDLSSTSPYSSIVYWWRMGDEDTYPILRDVVYNYQFPTIPDLSSNSYHGTATNMEALDIQNSSPGSQALVLVSEYFNMGNVTNFERTDSFSISCWFKTTNTSLTRALVGKMLGGGTYRGWELTQDDTNSDRLALHLISTYSSNTIKVYLLENFNDGIWHHVVVTYDGSSTAAGITFYVDNVVKPFAIEFNSLSDTIQSGTSLLQVGARYGDLRWIGSLGDVSIWNKELSVSEVSEIYNNTVPIILTNTSCSLNLVGWWRCGEQFSLAANGVPDFSGNGLHGTQIGIEYTDVESRTYIGKSVLLDGSNEYIDAGNILGFERTDSFSVSCWCKTSSTTGHHAIVSKMMSAGNLTGWELAHEETLDRLSFLLNNTWDTNTIFVRLQSNYNNGAWHHVVVTYNGSSNAAGITFYVDGISRPFDTINNTLSATIQAATPLQIGARNGALPWAGGIDEVSIWNKELSAPEVTAIYNYGIPTDLTGSANLVGYWRMGDDVGFSGTMVGMAAEDIVAVVP